MSRSRQVKFNGYGQGQVRVLAWNYAPGQHLEAHDHAWHQLIYAVTGAMKVETPGGTWTVPTHRAVWVPGRVTHAIGMSGTVAMRTLYFSPHLSRGFPQDCRVLSVSPLLRELVLHVIERGGLDRRRVRDAHLLDVLLDLLGDLPVDPLRIDRVTEPRAARVARSIADQPGERVSLGALAERAGASKRTIERAFSAETGVSFGRWRLQQRMAHALRLLAEGQPVTSVALDVGYDSVSAFVSRFRREFGVTPGRYFKRLPESARSR